MELTASADIHRAKSTARQSATIVGVSKILLRVSSESPWLERLGFALSISALEQPECARRSPLCSAPSGNSFRVFYEAFDITPSLNMCSARSSELHEGTSGPFPHRPCCARCSSGRIQRCFSGLQVAPMPFGSFRSCTLSEFREGTALLDRLRNRRKLLVRCPLALDLISI